MNMFEEARALWGTMRMVGMTQEQLASRLGVSQSYVANKLRLLRLSVEAQDEIVKQGLSERHARALLRITNDEVQRGMIRRVAEDTLSVAETEQIVDAMLEGGGSLSLHSISERLSRILAAYSSLLSGARITRTAEEDERWIKLTFLIEQDTKRTETTRQTVTK